MEVGVEVGSEAEADGDDSDLGPGWREARVKRPWYVSCERVLSRKVRIARASA